MSVEHVERIAVLEAEMRSVKEDQDKILARLDEIHSEMTKYKGFLGGIAFIASGIGIFLTLFKEWIIKHMG